MPARRSVSAEFLFDHKPACACAAAVAARRSALPRPHDHVARFVRGIQEVRP